MSLLQATISQLFSILVPSVLGKPGKADIVLASDSEKVVLPVVPANLPEQNSPQNNETFNGILGDMAVIGPMGSRSLKLESILPPTPLKYSWCRPNGDGAGTVINFIKKNQLAYKPIRITVVYSNGSVYLSMAALVNDFVYNVDNIGDYHYRLELTEYRTVTGAGGLSS